MSEPLGLTGEAPDHTIDSLRYAFGPFRRVEVSCSIEVNGQRITVREVVDAFAWDNGGSVLQESVKAAVQQRCALEAIKKFPPEITIRT